MEIESIAYFLTVAECLNFSEAAERNHISQSSFSKAIMRLEKDVGVKLIDRSKHPIRLTPAGRSFYEDCSRLRPQFREALKKLESYAEKRKLRVLLCPKSYAYRGALGDYGQAHPNDLIEYEQIGDYSQVTARLLEGGFDFCITPKPMVIPPTLKYTELYRDHLVLMVNQSSPLAQQESVSFRDLNGLDFIESPFSWYMLQELERYFDFQAGSIYPDEPGTVSHLVKREEVVHRVSRGMAVSIYCSRDVSSFKADSLRFLPIRELPELPVVLLEKNGVRERPEKAEFRAWVKKELEAYVCEELH